MSAPITLRQFLNAANALRFVDLAEFRKMVPYTATGVATSDSIGVSEWHAFLADPPRWLAKQPDAVAEAVFALAVKQEPDR